MGKKRKKADITPDFPPIPNESEQEFVKSKKNKKKFHTHTSSSHKAKTVDDNTELNRKKRRPKCAVNGDVSTDSTPIQVTSDIQENTARFETKKKKKRQLLNDQEPKEETDTDKVDATNDTLDIPMKKKKKNKDSKLLTEEENKQDSSIVLELEGRKLKTKKKKNIMDSTLNDPEKVENTISEDVNIKMKKTKTRSHKKKKSKTHVLNEEDSQVTEEDIDQFCAELGDKDNQQYEDWVRQIEASLPPPRTK